MNKRSTYLTTDDVAETLGKSTQVIRQMIAGGEFDGAFKAGRDWRIPERSVQDYIDRQTKTSLDEIRADLDL